MHEEELIAAVMKLRNGKAAGESGIWWCYDGEMLLELVTNKVMLC